jgi:FkbM family methyltransferase
VRVSVVVPVFDVPDGLLARCLDSLQRQTLRLGDYEVIVVDDCSTDDRTVATVNRFVQQVGPARLERHTRNQGLNAARRTGAASAKGEYVVFVDGDDILTHDALEHLWITAVRSDADISTAPFVRWRPDEFGFDPLPITAQPWPTERVPRLLETLSGRRSWTMCGRAFRRTILDDTIFDLPGRFPHEDLVTSVRLAFAAERVVAFPRPVYYYSVNGESITSASDMSHVDGIIFAVADWLRLARDHQLVDELEEGIQSGAEKMLGKCVERIVFNDTLSIADRAGHVADVNRRYDGLPMSRPTPRSAGTKLLAAVARGEDAAALVGAYAAIFGDDDRAEGAPSTSGRPRSTIAPSDIALATKDKIVFVCQVDYHLRHAADLARELRKRGHACAVLDNSRFADEGRRQLDANEGGIFWRTNRIVVEKPPYGVDWLSTARLVVLFNDLDLCFRGALEFRHRLGLPSVCVVEGINDFARVDFDQPLNLPYRRCAHVFLAGQHDASYFTDRSIAVVGLPGLEQLAAKAPRFPEQPLAVLNVNFTYGSLEDRRDEFVEQAVRGIAEAGFDLTITQHPMDRGDLADLPVSRKTQYQLIDAGSVFVSRFATGILEALASGKPAIYFNPHDEQVEKFTEPMGAFDIATTAQELRDALRRVRADIEAGVDFRERAGEFLRHHAALGLDERRAVERFADEALEVCADYVDEQMRVSRLVLDRLGQSPDASSFDEGLLLGSFTRKHHAQLNEEELIGRYFGQRLGLMVDVGANFGNSFDIYLGKGWIVHAFEPDPTNRARLNEYWPSQKRLVVNDLAVSDKAGQRLPFFSSEESTGISSLAAFTDGHRRVATVTTTTLDRYLAEWRIDHVDFLKVDVEGFDKFVLDGYPWDRDRPEVVLTEFEDSKTVPLGYTVDDLAQQMIEHGYTVYVSIWHPIIRYGISHDWKSLERYRPELALSDTWGNLIGFRDVPDETRLRALAELSVKFAPRIAPPRQPGSTASVQHEPDHGSQTPRSWYADSADRLRHRGPNVYRILRSLRRRWSTILMQESEYGPGKSEPNSS